MIEWRRRLAGLGATAAIVALAACNDFLVASNPSAIQEADLTDPAYVNLITNGVVGEFQPMFSNVAWWNGVYTDELYNRAVFFEEGLIDQRNVTEVNGTYAVFLYGPLHRTRWLADDGVRRMKEILGDSASRDLRVARALAYGGYSYLYLAEMLCNSPIDRSVPKTPDELVGLAIERFNEAVAVATAARAAAVPPTGAVALGADSVRFFALVGAARAALYSNNKTAAAGFATTVAQQAPANWEFRVFYSANSTRENNWFWNRLTSSTSGSMINTPFQSMAGDPRLPRIATGARQHVPLSPMGFSSWTATGADFTTAGFQRIASRLEADYILAEIAGPVGSTLTFVNARRAVGLQAPVTLTGDPLMAELRDQRRRDFYLSNHRLGDLRRYKRFLSLDEFPQGAYPGSTTGETYNAAATCWPLPLAELNDNPNIPR
ncbi:MAG: RagB/SusD family nutrient uptake outer membrane protein [Gemmatimonadota bacterium]